MPSTVKRALILIFAVVFLVIGVIGLALPFLQGFLFIAIGLILLSIYSPRMRAWIETHTRKYPRLHTLIEKVEVWIVKIVSERDA